MTKIFLGRDPTVAGKWQEWEAQAYVIQELRREGIMIEGDQNQGKRSFAAAARAKAAGMKAGSPDLRIFLYYQKLILIEVKIGTGKSDKRSQEQKDWHKEAEERGFIVHTVYCKTPMELLIKIRKIIADAL